MCQNRNTTNNYEGQRGGRRKQRKIDTIMGHRPYRFYHTPQRPPSTLITLTECHTNINNNTYANTDYCLPPNTNNGPGIPQLPEITSQAQGNAMNENMNRHTAKPIYCCSPPNCQNRTPRIPITTAKTNRQKPPITIVNINCQSIKNKQASFFEFINRVKPDIILGTESWLDPTIRNSEYFPPNFTVYRKDRNSHGGGVFIAVQQNIVSSLAPELDEQCEIIWAKIEIKGCRSLYVCSYYRPNVNDEESLTLLSKSISKLKLSNSNNMCIIGGDFNFPGWDWKARVLKEHTQNVQLHHDFIDILDDFSLEQLIEEPTRNNNTLDLIITNYPCLVTRQGVIPGISDHEAVHIEVSIHPIKNRQKPRTILLYKKANWDGLRAHMNNVTKLIVENFDDLSVEEAWQEFKQALESGIKQHIPDKLCKERNSQPWITHAIKKKIKKRDRCYKKYKKTSDIKQKETYQQLKHEIQRDKRNQYWKYLEELFQPDENEHPYQSMKKFWTYIKHCKKENSGISSINKEGTLLTSAHDKATALNEQFRSVFSKQQPLSLKQLAENKTRDENKHVNETQAVIDDIVVTPIGIAKLLKQLDPAKACGPDNIQARVLKELADEIAPCLCKIFQKSLNSGEVPSDWRKANVVPIFKNGEREIAANYRPVSLTCIASKILEHVIVSHIMKYSDMHEILYELQHGFRYKRSCETQLVSFIDDITKALENGQQTDVLVMDFSKAFDKVDHSLLCHKLRKYGITGKINRWIENFLRNRTQSVVVEGETSSSVLVKSGVPQGSVLGPTLFLFYINDLAENLKSTVRLFADDTIAYLTIRSGNDTEALQNDLNKLAEWEKEYRMEFHPQKCNVISITRKKESNYIQLHSSWTRIRTRPVCKIPGDHHKKRLELE